VCHTPSKGTTKFIDFGADLDFYGAILICEFCVVNAAESLGTLVSVAKWQLEESMRLMAYKGMAELREKVSALEHLIAAYGFDRHLDFDPDSSIDSPLPLG